MANKPIASDGSTQVPRFTARIAEAKENCEQRNSNQRVSQGAQRHGQHKEQ